MCWFPVSCSSLTSIFHPSLSGALYVTVAQATKGNLGYKSSCSFSISISHEHPFMREHESIFLGFITLHASFSFLLCVFLKVCTFLDREKVPWFWQLVYFSSLLSESRECIPYRERWGLKPFGAIFLFHPGGSSQVMSCFSSNHLIRPFRVHPKLLTLTLLGGGDILFH